MSGWAAVPARKMTAAMLLERWSKDSSCPESLAVTQLSCLLELEELGEMSVSKLAQHWGCSRKKATRMLLEWADWFEEEGPQKQREFPGWLRDIRKRHSKSTAQEQARHSQGTGETQEFQEVGGLAAQEGNRRGTGSAPRARSSSKTEDEPQPERSSGSKKPGSCSQVEEVFPELLVYREWERFYRSSRNQSAKRQQLKPYTATGPRLGAIRGALRAVDPATGNPYRPEDLILLVRYAFEAPPGAPRVDFWREKRGQYLGIENLMVAAKLATRMEMARDWEAGDLRIRPVDHGGSGVQGSAGRGVYTASASASSTPTLEPKRRSPQELKEAFEQRRLQEARVGGGAG